jgi:hypothetical protein
MESVLFFLLSLLGILEADTTHLYSDETPNSAYYQTQTGSGSIIIVVADDLEDF